MTNFPIKLGALILFLVDRCEVVNRTSLNKLCFFADIVSVMRRQKPISEGAYEKLPYGPVPAAMATTRAALLKWGYVSEKFDNNSGYGEYVYEISNVNLNLVREDQGVGFDDAVVNIISAVAEKLGMLTGSTLSNVTHSCEPWKSAHMGAKLDLQRGADDPALRRWLKSRGIDVPLSPAEADDF